MASFDGPDLLEEDFTTPHRGTAAVSEDREELDNQVSSLQTKLADLNRAREKLEREKATVEESRRRFTEFETGRDEMLHELTRGLGLLEEAQLDAQREAEQMAATILDLREALQKVEVLEDIDTHDENWKVLLTRNLTTLENARMELNAARLKWTLLNGEPREAGPALKNQTAPTGLPMPKSLGKIALWGLAFTWPILLIGAALIAVLLLKG